MKGGQLVKTFFFSLEDLYYAWDRSNHGLDQDNPQVMVSHAGRQAAPPTMTEATRGQATT